MNRLRALFNARELFALQRIWVFWLVALIALALPWLWFALTDHESVSNVVGNSVAVERRE